MDMPHSKRAQISRIPFEIVIFATLKSCRCFKQGIAMLPALYPDPLMLSCGFLPDEGTALAVGRLAPANFALIAKPGLFAEQRMATATGSVCAARHTMDESHIVQRLDCCSRASETAIGSSL